MDHTDKVVTLIDDARTIGLKVLPPDINASGYGFAMADERTIRYGLGAIKGDGGAAVEALVESAQRRAVSEPARPVPRRRSEHASTAACSKR